uniref:KIB1-4 beta-propeller domain-containing protein n=1 Tax=Setaria italica TaxID=4555 RepID=K3Y365_SETIT
FNPVYCKLAVPSPLESSLIPLVAIMHESWGLCIFQPPLVTDTIQGREPLDPFLEVSFFGGQLYAIDCSRKLINIELVEGLGHKPKISSFKCIIDDSDDLLGMPEPMSSDERYIVFPYLVECPGKLLMADLSTKPCRWRSVNDLGGHALFVSSSSSKSFPAGECCRVQENCIYFMNEAMFNPLHDSGVYNMKNGVIIPLLSDTAAVPSHHVGPWRPTWLFPTQAM